MRGVMGARGRAAVDSVPADVPYPKLALWAARVWRRHLLEVAAAEAEREGDA
jgi:hypothetical protein